ncbi:MAG: hypothetical protein ACLGHX_14915 [Acidimicrobiia bacterium]
MDDRHPTSDRLRRLASRYEAGVGRGRAEQIAARAITRAHRRSSVGRRLAVAVSSSAFLLVSMTGIGFAADRAVPGDLLYPLDRALEAVGLTSDLVEERLLEAITLTERGDMALAIETANEALAELSRSGVSATLPPITPDTATLTADTVEAASTTTTDESVSAENTSETETVEDDTQVVEAAPIPAAEALRLAAEQLLQSVRSAKTDGSSSDEVASAAIFLAEATANVSSIQMSVDTSTTSSSTTTSTSTTTTTVAEEPRPGNRNGNDGESGTTTTTVTSDPDDGTGSDDSTGGGEDGSTGPIFLPAP